MSTFTTSVDRYFWAFIFTAGIMIYLPLLAFQFYSIRGEAERDVYLHAQTMSGLLESELDEKVSLAKLLGQIAQEGIIQQFDQSIKAKVGHLGLKAVKAFDKSGRIVYATDATLIGKNAKSSSEFQKAAAGEWVNNVIDDAEHLNKYGVGSNGELVAVYQPVYDENGEVTHIFETYQDLTPITVKFRKILFKQAFLLAVVLFGALLFLAVVFRRHKLLKRKVDALPFLPICSCCKKVRLSSSGEEQHWESFEDYFGIRQGRVFSHGYCPDCLKDVYEDAGIEPPTKMQD